MSIIVKHSTDIQKEEAHGGAGSRRLYIDQAQTPSGKIQGVTHGWMPAGKSYDWHSHEGIEEIMYVIKGEGIVADRDGEYTYEPGTVCVFPSDVEHMIKNTSDTENEFVFVRIFING
ncbi:MAG: cupin domain-containing protein [Candidatus Saccharibacteria bacterium]